MRRDAHSESEAVTDRARLEELRLILPGREPEVVAPVSSRADAPLRIVPVCETLLDGNELAYLTECVRSNWISSQGPFVARFEKAFAEAVGCRFGVACSSGTAALHLALAAIGLQAGDEVILPSFTMIATVNAASYTGATPVLVDSDPVTWNLDLAQLEQRITASTKAIVIVHTYGRPVDMEPVRAFARRHRLWVVEDAAEAHGSQVRGRPVGSLGDLAAFSFYGNKIITTGEGGMVTTNDPALAEKVQGLRDHGFSSDRHFWHSVRAFNYRMTNLQAAVGLAQTERFESLVEARRRNARLYANSLKDVPGLTLPNEDPDTRNVYWMYGLLVEDEFGCSRDALRGTLAQRGIETRTFFVPMHLQPAYQGLFDGQRFPIAENLCRRGMYLPSGPGLTASDVQRIASEIVQVHESCGGPRRAREQNISLK